MMTTDNTIDDQIMDLFMEACQEAIGPKLFTDGIKNLIAQEANKAAVNALTSYNDWLNAEGRIRSERSNEYHRRIQALTADKESL